MKPSTIEKLQPRNFRVTYYQKQWFVTYVEAKSFRAAKCIVQDYLDWEADELRGSTRLHYDDGITKIEVQP